MNKIIVISIIIIFLLSTSLIANIPAFEIDNEKSEEMRIVKHSEENSFDGYILYTPWFDTMTYLIDNNNDTVRKGISFHAPALAVYLLENGQLLRSEVKISNPTFAHGGISGLVKKFWWSGKSVWEFEYSNNLHCLHNDIEPLPNGNILMAAWEYKTYDEAIDAGCNPNLLTEGEIWPDHIIEVEPTGSSGGNIVWEWHVWDHLIQDYDPLKDNYGIVADHPELIDINFRGSSFKDDWNHIDSIDYNEEFNQILLSVRHMNEIWVIDHSTTTEDAANHSGGNSGKGGDLLYRWGNPQTYRAGYENDQQLFGQHDARWIKSDIPGEGHITIFNNGWNRPEGKYSSVEEIVPPVDNNGSYYLTPGSAYGPEGPIWRYTAENKTDFYSSFLSGAQRISNGNTLICSGENGIFFEVNPGKEIVWEYINPFPVSFLNNVFKFTYYPPDYPGLEKFTNSQKNNYSLYGFQWLKQKYPFLTLILNKIKEMI